MHARGDRVSRRARVVVLTSRGEPRSAIVVGIVVLEALAWSALSMLLAAHDHVPSGPPLLPIAPADYYAAQAWFALPVVLASFALQVFCVRAILPNERAITIVGIGVSVPILVLWVCGDLIAFGFGGFEAMQRATHFIVPLALLSVLALVAILAKRSGASTARALGTALTMLLVRGLVFAPFMR